MAIYKLRGMNYVPKLSLSSSVDILSQISSCLYGLSSDISQIMQSWNDELHPVMEGLPKGVLETRWNLSDDINPFANGLDGANYFVDNNASLVIDSGRFWDDNNQRPKTVKETLNSLYTTLSSNIDLLRSEINTVGDSGLTASQIARIGDNIFDATKTSLSTSLDGLTASNNLHAVQLAKDLYDLNDWSWTSDGSEKLTNYSVKDMVNELLVLHGGLWDQDISINHNGLGGGSGGSGYSFITGGTNEEASSTSDIVVGGFTFDPSEYGAASIDLFFEGELNYIAATAAGTGRLRLYDMGAPGSTGPGTLRSTLERDHTAGNLADRVRLELTTTASPSTDAEEIYTSARVYELRISVDGAGDSSDIIKMIWGGIVVQTA